MSDNIVTIVGGSGFLGRYVVRRLARAGWRIRVVVRNPDAAAPLKTAGDVGQISIVTGNIAKPETLAQSVEGSAAVVNLVGILFQSGRQNFNALHARGAEQLAMLARDKDVRRLVHLSSLGVEKASGSDYARTKVLGERAVRAVFPQATILRPSVMFGPEDNFFNQFAAMAANPLVPCLPIIGSKTRFQPVYVDDVANAVVACLTRADAPGQTYELGGPNIYSFRDIVTMAASFAPAPKSTLAVPFSLASVIGAFGEWLPRPPLTRDQVRLLKYDNIVSRDAKGFADLGITPTAVEGVIPGYLQRFGKKAAAA